MLFSRGINLREIDTLALVPYADLINHSPYAQTFFMLGSIPLSPEKEARAHAAHPTRARAPSCADAEPPAVPTLSRQLCRR